MIGLIITIILQLAIVPIGYIVQRIDNELGRKWCHISTGVLMWIGCCFLIKDPILIASLLVIYTSVVAILRNFDMIPDKRDDDKDNNSKAVILYGLGELIMALLLFIDTRYMLHFGLAVFTLAFGDAFAALIGIKFGKYGPKLINNKSLIGTIAFIVFAIIGMLIPCMALGYELTLLPKIVFLAIIGCIVELYAADYDNLLIQIIVGFMALILI